MNKGIFVRMQEVDPALRKSHCEASRHNTAVPPADWLLVMVNVDDLLLVTLPGYRPGTHSYQQAVCQGCYEQMQASGRALPILIGH